MILADSQRFVPGDVVVRRASLAVRPIDGGRPTPTPVVDGVEATAFPYGSPAFARTANSGRGNGVIGFTALPGLMLYERGDGARAEWLGPNPTKLQVRFVVIVSDRLGRYQSSTDLIDVPVGQVIDVPMFPGPDAASWAPGTVRLVAQVVRRVGGAAVPGAVVEASTPGGVLARGVTDGRGAVALAVIAAPVPGEPIDAVGGAPFPVDIVVRAAAIAPDTTVALGVTYPAPWRILLRQPPATVNDLGTPVTTLRRTVTGPAPFVLSSSSAVGTAGQLEIDPV